MCNGLQCLFRFLLSLYRWKQVSFPILQEHVENSMTTGTIGGDTWDVPYLAKLRRTFNRPNIYLGALMRPYDALKALDFFSSMKIVLWLRHRFVSVSKQTTGQVQGGFQNYFWVSTHSLVRWPTVLCKLSHFIPISVPAYFEDQTWFHQKTATCLSGHDNESSADNEASKAYLASGPWWQRKRLRHTLLNVTINVSTDISCGKPSGQSDPTGSIGQHRLQPSCRPIMADPVGVVSSFALRHASSPSPPKESHRAVRPSETCTAASSKYIGDSL